MGETKKYVNNHAGAESGLNAGLERLIDGDVTCWGIDDVVAYGLKAAAMEREACARLADAHFIFGHSIAGPHFAEMLANKIRMRSNDTA